MRILAIFIVCVAIVALTSSLTLYFFHDELKEIIFDMICLSPRYPDKRCKTYTPPQREARIELLNINETKTWEEFCDKLSQIVAIVHFGRPYENYLPECARTGMREKGMEDYNTKTMCPNVKNLIVVRELILACRKVHSMVLNIKECKGDYCKWEDNLDFCTMFTTKTMMGEMYSKCVETCEHEKGIMNCLASCCVPYNTWAEKKIFSE